MFEIFMGVFGVTGRGAKVVLISLANGPGACDSFFLDTYRQGSKGLVEGHGCKLLCRDFLSLHARWCIACHGKTLLCEHDFAVCGRIDQEISPRQKLIRSQCFCLDSNIRGTFCALHKV
jgi:hypothetical protein